MKILPAVVVIFLNCTQTFSQGLIFDQAAFDKGEQYESERSDFVPSSFSLKKYAPFTFEQQFSTCVAYSTATALSMMVAINNRETDPKQISIKAASPHWIYYRNRDDTDTECKEGLNIDKTMIDVLNTGVPNMLFVEYPDYYPFGQVQLCNYYPPDYQEDVFMASINKPDQIYRIKEADLIKLSISNGLPVVIGMNVPLSFEKSFGLSLWSPLATENKLDAYGHAMVVVGYNDDKHGGAFEILNSWGESWGDNGYIWIKYSDFKKFFLGGYALYKEQKLGADITSKSETNADFLKSDIKLSKAIKKKGKISKKWKVLIKK
jgi:C1A family cysteine protease